MRNTKRKIEPELLRFPEVEAMTGRSRWCWRRDAHSGAVESVRIGRSVFIPIAEVRRFISVHTRPRLKDVA
jgi:predicted DNA-binding transcriptional regulator AlpA